MAPRRRRPTTTTPPIVVSWAAGDLTQKVVTVPINEDHDDEMPETIHLALTHPTGGAVIREPLGTSTLTINDNDIAGSIGFGIPFYSYGEDGTPFGLEVTVFRTGGMDGEVSATLSSVDGTANSDPNSLGRAGRLHALDDDGHVRGPGHDTDRHLACEHDPARGAPGD